MIAGASAGALAVYLGIDQMADIISQHADTSTASATSGSMNIDRTVKGGSRRIRVRGLADSGFFMQYSSGVTMSREQWRHKQRPEAVVAGRLDYAEAMRNVFTFMNVSAGANPACIAARKDYAHSSLRNHSAIGNELSKIAQDDIVSGRLNFGSEADCIFAEYLGQHLKTPVFTMQVSFI